MNRRDNVISIVNVTKNPFEVDPNLYELRINHSIIGRFHHSPEEGLAMCLLKAAQCAMEVETMARRSAFTPERGLVVRDGED